MPLLGERFDRALLLASELHREQPRKGTTIPYLSHLLAVAALVLEHGGGEDEAIAALLHDAPEDQGGRPTLDRIRAEFGERVGELVAGASDTFEQPKPAWKERKQRYLEHLEHADEAALRLSLADKLHNARCMLSDLRAVGPATWQRFKGGREGTLWYLGSVARIARERRVHPRLLRELEEVLELLERGA